MPNHKCQVKPHPTSWFSLSCTAAIEHRNKFFHLFKRNKLVGWKASFRQANNHCKRVIESAKNCYTEKTESFVSQRIDSHDFWCTGNSVLNREKVAIPALFNDPDVLAFALEIAKLFTEFFSKNSNLDDSGCELSTLNRRTDITLSNIIITPKMVRKAISDLGSYKASCPDGISIKEL